jgi:hypothetical protein
MPKLDESIELAAEVARRILKSRWTDVSEQSRLFTDLVEMTRAGIRREPLFGSSKREIPRAFPVST